MTNLTSPAKPKPPRNTQQHRRIRPTSVTDADGCTVWRMFAPRIPDVSGLSLREAALAYAEAGLYVLPLAPGTKVPHRGVNYSTDSSCDLVQISEWWDENPDFGIGLHMKRSRLVAFDLDSATLEQLPPEMADGLRAGLVQRSRRAGGDNPDRGHYVFFDDFGASNAAGAFGSFGEVRGGNAYIVVEPTPHTKPDGEYRWLRTGDVPDLPAVLRDCLSKGSSKEVAPLTNAELQAFLDDPTHCQSDEPGRMKGPLETFVNGVIGGASIHEMTPKTLCWLFRESRAGAYPAVEAMVALQTEFLNAFASRSGGAGERTGPGFNEFQRGAAWAAAQIKDDDPDELRQRMNRDDPAHADIDEEAFWSARPELAQLRDFARSRRVGPWSMFGAVLARAVAVIPPSVVLPDLRGSHGSLNLFVAVVAPSGKGKGTSEAAADDALHTDPEVHTATPGSGEGILKEYAYKRRTEQVDLRNSVMFSVPEIDSLAALKARSASTLMPELRKAWMGEQLGFGYAADDKKFAIKRHRYRMTMVVGVQPGRSQTLFEDADGGTPQRFLFFPTIDPHRPRGQRPANPGALKLPRWPGGVLVTEGREPSRVAGEAGELSITLDLQELDLARRADPDQFQVLQVAQVIEDAVDAETEADLDGAYTDDLDSHGTMARLKVAAALMWLNGRTDAITEDDWDLAGVVKAVSDRTRAITVGDLRQRAERSNEARAKAEARREVVKTDEVAEQRMARAVALVRKHVQEAGRISRKAGRLKLKNDLRDYYDDAVERLVNAGVVTREDGQQGSYEVVFKEVT